jgi:heme/copper-type cytochrome/quinol oxidase subunit 3
MDRKAYTPLRIAVLIAAGLGTLFWLGSLVQWWNIPNDRRDGFELMGVALSSAFFVFLVLPALVLGMLARALPFAAMLGVIVVVLASDTLWHWLPW